MSLDNRQSSRYPISRKVVIIQSNGKPVNAIGCDISVGGVGVLCEYNCDIGKVFEVRFYLSADKQSLVSAKAEVMYVNLVGNKNQYRIGFRFTEVFGSGQQNLEKYIASRSSAPNWI